MGDWFCSSRVGILEIIRFVFTHTLSDDVSCLPNELFDFCDVEDEEYRVPEKNHSRFLVRDRLLTVRVRPNLELGKL